MKSSEASAGQKPPQRSSRGPLLLGLLILGIIAAIAIPLYLGFSNMMGGGPAPQTAQQFTASTPGSQVKVMVQVTGLSSQTRLTGNLLNKNSDGTYSPSGQEVSVNWDPAHSVTMGSSSDVKVGAILQISGPLGTDNVLTASQVVVLTSFVQIK